MLDTYKEEEIIKETKEFAEFNGIHYNKLTEGMILNAMREVKSFFKLSDEEKLVQPTYSPGDSVSYAIVDEPYRFKVVEVNHRSREYKLVSESLIKSTTIYVGWDEID